IRQLRAVGQLEVDPVLVGDDREQEAAHPHRSAERDQLVAEVDLLDGVGELRPDRRAQPPLDRLGLRGVLREQPVDVGLDGRIRLPIARWHRAVLADGRHRPPASRTTMLTSLPPPATTTRSGRRPARIARTRSLVSAAASRSVEETSDATVILSRSFPLTWTGTSRVASTTADGSTSGHRSVWIDAHGSWAAASRRDQSSSVMCGAAGASIRTAR